MGTICTFRRRQAGTIPLDWERPISRSSTECCLTIFNEAANVQIGNQVIAIPPACSIVSVQYGGAGYSELQAGNSVKENSYVPGVSSFLSALWRCNCFQSAFVCEMWV